MGEYLVNYGFGYTFTCKLKKVVYSVLDYYGYSIKGYS